MKCAKLISSCIALLCSEMFRKMSVSQVISNFFAKWGRMESQSVWLCSKMPPAKVRRTKDLG